MELLRKVLGGSCDCFEHLVAKFIGEILQNVASDVEVEAKTVNLLHLRGYLCCGFVIEYVLCTLSLLILAVQL